MIGKVKVRLEDLATFIAGLVKEGICFDSYESPTEGFYIVELTGGC